MDNGAILALTMCIVKSIIHAASNSDQNLGSKKRPFHTKYYLLMLTGVMIDLNIYKPAF